MTGQSRETWKRYGGAVLALGAVVAALVILRAVMGLGGGEHPALRFVCLLPVIWVAMHYGFGPALIVVGGTTLVASESLLVVSPWKLTLAAAAPLGLYAATAGLVAWYMSAYRKLQLGLGRQVAEQTAQVRATNAAMEAEIRDRRANEDAARRSAMYLDQIINSVTDPLFMKDAHSRMMLVNDAMCRMTGVAREDIVGRDGFEKVPAEQAAIFRQQDLIVLQTGQESVNEELFTRPDGSVRTLLTKKMPFIDESGQRFLVGIIRDITEQKAAQDVLRSRVAAVDAAADVIVITDRKAVIQYVNPAFTRVTGYTREEAIGQHTSILKSGTHDVQFYKRLWETIMGGQTWTGEMMNRRKDGTHYAEEASITPVRDETGEIVRFVAIKRDIEARKHAARVEEERNHLRGAVQGMERVLGVVGHELRTPLAALRAMSELLLNEEVRQTTQATEFIQSMHDETIRMAGIVADLLEAARLQSGTSRWNWSAVAVEDCCRAAMTSLGHLESDGQVAMELHGATGGVEMCGDTEAIRRLVLNLLTNARKHTEKGRIDVYIWSEEVDGERWVEIEVADTGRGIPPEVAARLGEAFAMNAGIVGPQYVDGAGLGLAICRGVVAAHGGTLRLRSAPGMGTRAIARLRGDLAGPTLGAVTPIKCELSQLET